MKPLSRLNIAARLAIVPLAVALMLPAAAQSPYTTPESGEYQVDGGWGTLVVKRVTGKEAGKEASFKINANGANGHSCELDGAISNGIANVDTGEAGKACRVAFTATSAGIDVKPLTAEECRYFCGMRASFDGLYAKAVPGCENAARQQTRKRFKKLYDAKQYEQARATLEPLLTKCAKSLIWIEDGSLRNDLAITQYHLQAYSDCLETLKPFQGDQPDQKLEDLKATEPSSADAYAAILGPARHNIMLCTKAMRL